MSHQEKSLKPLYSPPKANIGILLEGFLTFAIDKGFYNFFLSLKEKIMPTFMVPENGI